MSVILEGLGLDVDSQSSIVAWGLTRDLEAGESIEQAIIGSSIENLFVIDFGGRRRMTASEFRRFKRRVKQVETTGLHFKESKRRRNGISFYSAELPAFKYRIKKAA
jgi:hypothetical protein